MLKIVFSISLVLLLFACDQSIVKMDTPTVTIITPEPDSLLRHVVLFKFNETSTTADIKQIEEAFSALPSKISEIYDYEWGTDNSPEGLNKGLTHCFFVTFESEAGRAAYLPHPAHKAFVELIGPHVADVTVVDYWAK